MRLLANQYIRSIMLTVTAILFLYAIAIQFISGHFSLLLFSLAASGAILFFCIRYFKKEDCIIEEANDQITRFLSGKRNERIDCDEEGELFCLFQSVNIYP